MSLTPFQQNAAHNAYQRLNDDKGSGRFLIADEVGLGKTIIAREIVRRFIEKAERDDVKSFTVVYICSNQLLARKNLKKLKPCDLGKWKIKFFPASRLSLLALDTHLIKNLINTETSQNEEEEKICYFYALTPGTSLNITNGNGTVEERMMLYLLAGGKVDEEFTVNAPLIERYGTYKKDNKVIPFTCWQTLYNSLHEKENWTRLIELFNSKNADIEKLKNSFNQKIDAKIYEQRKLLTQFGASLLKPNLVVFDEFQNYEKIFIDKQVSNDDEQRAASEELDIINSVFAKLGTKPKYLLLSATPFAPLTMNEEISRGEVNLSSCDAFTRLVEWLLGPSNDKNFTSKWTGEKGYSGLFKEFCRKLSKKDDVDEKTINDIKEKKDEVQGIIRSVMSRTERPADLLGNLVQDIDKKKSVLSEMSESRKEDCFYTELNNSYSRQLLDFEKYALKPLTGMRDDYSFITEGERKKRYYLQADSNLINISQELEAEIKNPYFHRLCQILGDEKNIDYSLLFWMPPTVPFYELKGPFKTAHENGFSKILIFSAWRFIPRMISAAMSNHIESRIWNDKVIPEKLEAYHFFTTDGLRAKELLDSRYDEGADPEEKIFSVFCSPAKSVYYALSKLDPSIKFNAYIKQHCQIWSTKIAYALLQRMLRADGIQILSKTWEILKEDEYLRSEKFRIKTKEEHVSRETLAEIYCYAGCFSAVAYEYLYLLFQESHADKLDKKIIDEICGTFYQTLKLRAHPIQLDFYGKYEKEDKMQETGIYSKGINLHFADCFSEREKNIVEMNSSHNSAEKSVLPRILKELEIQGGNIAEDEEKLENTPIRNDTLQSAFNSPFKPFVLTTTSIGQEGLDFHWYCRKIMHWNLPHSPLEFDQREGRINRYCSFALRQILAKNEEPNKDFSWEYLFRNNQQDGNNADGLIPMWLPPLSLPVSPDKDCRKIERIVPFYPLSREHLYLDNLMKLQAIYRMVMGQPHQEELLSLIQGLSPEDQEKIESLTISLSPEMPEKKCIPE